MIYFFIGRQPGSSIGSRSASPERPPPIKRGRKSGRGLIPEAVKKLAPVFGPFAESMSAMHDDYTSAELALLLDYHTRCVQILKSKTDELRQQSK
jgi:hypothetical protein